MGNDSDAREAEQVLLAIDPGTAKCGLAVVSEAGTRLHLEVAPTANLGDRIRELHEQYPVGRVLLGDRTGSAAVREILAQALPRVPVTAVCEHLSTLRARELYFADHPPRGLMRLLPKGLRVPPVPHDEYVALVLALDFLGQGTGVRR
jgi:RNase H-fold protein (predicted Holliday junction resolvase)